MITAFTAYEMVKSGQWSFEQFEDWAEARIQDGYEDGYDAASKPAIDKKDCTACMPCGTINLWLLDSTRK